MDLLVRIIGIVLPVFAVVGAGYLYARHANPDMSVANRINIDVFCPVLIFSSLSSANIELANYQNLAMVAVAIVMLSGVITYPLARMLKVDWRTFVPPTMFSNSGNLGIPLILFAFGEEFLAAAVILFVIENTLHFSLGINMINRAASVIKNLASPMVLSAIIGIIFSYAGWHVWQPLASALEMVAQIPIPLLLFSLGVRLFQTHIRHWKLGIIAGIATPLSGLIIAALFIPFFTLTPEETAILVLYAALPPAVLNYLVAERYNQDPGAVASIVIVGNLLSLVTIPLTLAYCFSKIIIS